jgi:RNA polymerase sigma-70 factor, ECF subfamily
LLRRAVIDCVRQAQARWKGRFRQEFSVDVDNTFAGFIAPIKPRMFETVWRVLRHSQDAEDALQNALITAWRQRSRIERHPTPQALILKICADAAIDQFRRSRRGNERVDVAPFAESLPSARSPPVQDAIEHETLEIVMEAISRLSPNQATAIVMRFIQEESNATIAAALGCGTETVLEHLDRGKERLRQMLGHLAPHGWNSASSNSPPLFRRTNDEP